MRFSTKRIESPSGVKKQFWDAVSRAVDASAQKYLNAIIKEIAPHKKSGDLLRSWKLEKIAEGYVEVYSTDPASIYLDQGTQAHPIDAKGKLLRWAKNESGQTVPIPRPRKGQTHKQAIEEAFFPHEISYAKHVNHPGNKGIDYIQRAWDSVQPEIDDIMAYGVQEGLDEWIGDIAKVSYMQVSPRTGRVFYGRRGAGGRFISRSAP